MREGVSPSPSPLLHRAMPNIRAVPKSGDAVDGLSRSTPPTSPQLGKLIIRAARSPDRAASPDYVRTPATVVGPTSPTSPHRQVRGAYVNVQGDEGKTTSTSGTSSADEQRDCTGRTGRLEAAPRTSVIASHSKDESKTRTLRSRVHDENQPPQPNGDACTTNVRAIVPSSAVNCEVSLNNPANLRMDLDKSGLCPKILQVTGNTPKLGGKLLVSDLDTPSFCRRSFDLAATDNRNTVEESATSLLNDCDSSDKSSSIDHAELSATCPDNQTSRRSDCSAQGCGRTDRKVKRSESYRMANSPIMFIKKFSNNAEKSSKICRTPSEELQEELLKERINYPETVSSPEPQVDGNVGFDMNLTSPVPIQSGPTSPRPRASDLEPARVLKYSSNDTEIW